MIERLATAVVDLYEVLGVARSASAGDLRRAYRRLALAHHPDRAGAASAPTFARIADAYRLLSNPVARATYDATLADHAAWRTRDQGPIQSGGVAWSVGTNGWRATREKPIVDLLPRVSGRLETLTSAGIVRARADGALAVTLTAEEARTGGTAAILMSIKVACATCGGVARPRGVWCRTCEHAGSVTEDITVPIAIPAGVRRGTRVELNLPRAAAPRLRVHLDVGA